MARATCDLRPGCEPGSWQVAAGSRFVAALNRGDPTREETAYTSIYSQTDEFTRPPEAATRLEGARQIGIQEVCPGRPVEHLQESDDAATFAIVGDALDHPGPADIERIPLAACLAGAPPGFDPARRAGALAGQAAGVPGPDPTTSAEPPLRCYADRDCS